MGKRRAPTIRAKASSRRSKLRPRPTAPRKKTSNQEDTSTQDSSSSRDWSDLSDGPTNLIASHILTNGDVADYIRFRVICRSWRVSCPSPLTHPILDDCRLHPRQWIMLVGDDDEKLTAAGAPHRTRRRFLNVSTGQCVHVDIPELHDHGVLRSSTDGLILLVSKDDATVRLLNPLTRQVAELPPINGLGLDFSHAHIGQVSPNNAGLVDDDGGGGGRNKVMLYHYDNEHDCNMVAFAKPGDERWVVVKLNSDHHRRRHHLFTMRTMPFAGRFYGIVSDSVVVALVAGTF
nr:unnamed protein product [Digitaria exilis]